MLREYDVSRRCGVSSYISFFGRLSGFLWPARPASMIRRPDGPNGPEPRVPGQLAVEARHCAGLKRTFVILAPSVPDHKAWMSHSCSSKRASVINTLT